MYAFLWRLLPGPVWLKSIIALAIVVGIFFLLMNVVFPWADTLMPYNDISVSN